MHIQFMGVEYLLRIELSDSLPIYSDKCILPQTVLSKILELHDESSLPHPLIFKLKDNENNLQVFVGVREFSSPENDLLIVPKYISRKLNETSQVTIELVENTPKASLLKLRPLHFYSDINNWKYFLEDKLTSFYTTLTKGEDLIIESNNLRYELLIEDLNEEVACIIDTDITLDISPLNDYSGHQQVEFKAFTSNTDDIFEIENQIEVPNLKPLADASFVPTIYKVDLTRFKKDLTIQLEVTDSDKDAIFNVDLLVGFDKLVNMENFTWTTIDEDSQIRKRLNFFDDGTLDKMIYLDLSSDRIKNRLSRYNQDDDNTENEKWLFIIPFAWHHDSSTRISLIPETEDSLNRGSDSNTEASTDHETCSNCRKRIPSCQLALHEAFCIRNNIKCSCGQIFHKQIPSSHWHCEICLEAGNAEWLNEKHQKLYHQSYSCRKCESIITYDSYVDLITQHMGTKCSNKLHECKFCHLIVPQGEATYQDNFENLTNHENLCGNKTTECYRCSKILRRKDLVKHLKVHDLEKVQIAEQTKATFSKCCNVNCLNLLQGESNLLKLCDICYGPFYNPSLDLTDSKLQSRLERKYMMQLTKGCGNTWCQNQYCKSGNPALSSKPNSIKELIALINDDLLSKISSPLLPVNKTRTTLPSNTLYLCVNESVSQKMSILQDILSEHKYNEEIVYKALNLSSSEEAARAWLKDNAILVN